MGKIKMNYCMAALLLFGGLAVGQEALTLTKHIPLPNVKGRLDHFGVDLKGQRLFVAGVGNGTLEVIDLKAGQRVRTITDLEEPQGVYYDAATSRLFVACGGNGVTNVYDGTTFKLIASHKFPDDADNIHYDARNKQVIVGYAGAKELRKREEGTGGLGFLDTNGKLIREIVIDAHPESFRLEEKGTRIFVNVPDKQEIEVVDTAKGAILARWPVTSAKNNFPMTLDEAHHRVIVGAWMPPRLLAFDTDSGKQVASAEIAGNSDDLFYDAARSRVYVLTTPGFLEVFQQKDADHYDRIARYATPPGTQTGLFVPELGKLFAGVQGRDKQPSEVLVYEAK
jgi:DNA-binding beta-propeller fold protein YncE